ncbi:O-antigen ligase family protein [Caldicellulosiruptor morganii]|uniref:O-antigen ligase family protein n=1 Tax=Caldicellulosiruptor morganii TaxID=1387555 RepID=A0ABY7BJC3_9FIRM|nr:O-antigen ligase family protein [Caldicellulosiruptor morganii]WAM32933.1 O-antigen ligase family protein [Caldicellulosiruptor morganii]
MEKPFNLKIKERYLPFIIYLAFLTGFFGSTLAYPRLSYLFLYRIFLGLLFMLIFIDMILNGVEIKKFLNFSSYFLAGWIAYSLLSFLWAQDIKSALRDQVFLTGNILVILIFMYYSNYIKWNILENIILFSYTINVLVGYWEVITDKHLWTSKVSLYNLHRTPSTFFSNPNDFATFLVLYLPFILNFVINKGILAKKVTALIDIILSVPLLILTTSRANYIGFVLVLTVYFLLIEKSEKREYLKYSFAVFLFLIILIGFRLDFGLFSKAGQIISTQLLSLFDFSDSTLSSNVRRELLIVYGLSFLYDYLFFGVGSGNSRALMEKVKQYTINVELHNWFLDVLVCYGIIVFVFYIVWILYIVYKLLQIKCTENKFRLPAISIISSIAAFGFSSISSSKMIEMRIMWFLFALAVFIISNIQKSKGEQKS